MSFKKLKVKITKLWNPNDGGGVWFPVEPKIGDIIEIEQYTTRRLGREHITYRWCPKNTAVCCKVPKDCFIWVGGIK
jgi:hypothetical protein